MLNDISAMNPKGQVKLELYNEDGVFYTKEKKNLVVQSANRIVAEMMADPAKVIRVNQVDSGDTVLSTRPEGGAVFPLTVHHEKQAVFENNWGTGNVTTNFALDELKGITSLDEVKVGETELVINADVTIADAEIGSIEFTQAPQEPVTIKFHKVANPYMRLIEGTEQVTVNDIAWKRGAEAKNTEGTYVVDYRTGEIIFETPKENVKVEYDYHMNYSLGFMALGGKPNPAHQNYQPVEFGHSNKLDIDMKNEFAGSRMPVHFPAEVSEGATELEPAIPTQPIRTVLKVVDNLEVTDNGDGVTKQLEYTIPNLHDNGSGDVERLLHELVSVENTTKGHTINLVDVEVVTNSIAKIELKFRDEDVDMGDILKVQYRLKLDDLHLIYQLGQSPVVKLVSVIHHPADGSTPKSYDIVDNGLNPNQGDVWISNPNTGHITFSNDPVGGYKVETPGQLTVEYQVNSGTKVKFVADFPKGVPAPELAEEVKTEIIASGQTTILLNNTIAKDETGAFIEPKIEVLSGGSLVELTSGQYSIAVDGRTVSINSLTVDDEVTITYQYEKSTHDIYQVAMFDNKEGGRMFNISGIGPVTKDKNTGMRVTWSVTF